MIGETFKKDGKKRHSGCHGTFKALQKFDANYEHPPFLYGEKYNGYDDKGTLRAGE